MSTFNGSAAVAFPRTASTIAASASAIFVTSTSVTAASTVSDVIISTFITSVLKADCLLSSSPLLDKCLMVGKPLLSEVCWVLNSLSPPEVGTLSSVVAHKFILGCYAS